MLIAKFYKDQDIFITGGSGFLGKALIEKLLHSCPDIGNIFVLIRGKKGKKPKERLQEIMRTKMFNRVLLEQPQTLSKVVAVEGDCTQLGLGIGAEDLEKMRNVSIIFHSAATIRFDEPLCDAVLMNTRGTLELVKIAKTLGHLKVFVHISTAYSNAKKLYIEEKVYPPLADWRTTIKLAETCDKDLLDVLTLKYGSYQPNTYTLTKSLAEQIINDYRHELPIVLFRPSIVTWAMQEPKRGWIDNLNGPGGMMMANCTGLARALYADPEVFMDYMPVDVVARSLIIAAYKRGFCDKERSTDSLDVINCCSHFYFKLTTYKINAVAKSIIHKYPYENTLWAPCFHMEKRFFFYFLKMFGTGMPLCFLFDLMFRLRGRKPILVKIQRRIFDTSKILRHFALNSWKFDTDNFRLLNEIVPKTERQTYAFKDLLANIDFEVYIKAGLLGSKEFLLNENVEDFTKARRRFRFLESLNFCILLVFGLLIARFLIPYMYKTLN